MKQAVFVLVALGLMVVAIYFFLGPESGVQSGLPTSPTLSKAPQNPTFCRLSDLKALIQLEGTAGDMYATLSIQDITTHPCTVIGSNFIGASSQADNLAVSRKGSAGPASVTLTPSQTVYSQVHFPNGPHCSSQTKIIPVIFNYHISPTESVNFQDATGKIPQPVMTCSNQTEITQIDVWSLSNQPANQ